MEVFAHPRSLWLLAALPLLLAWVVRGLLRRKRDWALLGQGSRLRRDGSLGWLAAIACLILAIAQPRWGRGAFPPLPPGHDIVFLVDTSRSMGAEDAVPNRIGVATETAESLVRALGEDPGNRAAVVAFAGRGRLRCPLTENLGAALESLKELRPGDVQPGGTDLGAGLDVAIDAFGEQDRAEGRTIILFSDGEDHAGTWATTINDLRQAGIVVHSIAIGDPARGHSVPSGQGLASLTYQGSPVLSKRDDRAFETLARETGGAFLPIGLASVDLGRLYQKQIAPVARQKREAIRPSEKSERYPIFVATALALGLWGSWPSRGRWLRSRRWIMILGLLAPLGAGDAQDSAAARIAHGRSAYAAGRFGEALTSFERAIVLDPRGAVPRYNAAATLYRLERYADASARYREARERADSALRTKIDYALGNTALVSGDLAAALGHYEDCLASTAPGKALDAVRLDAAVNRRYAEEQAKPPSSPTDSGDDPSNSSNRSPSPNPEEEEGRSQDRSEANNPNAADGGQPGPRRPSGRQGPGGNGSTPPRADSPEGRLNAALKNIREARDRRPDEALPPTDDQRMDW
ncbi:VWA domain-containing protein [Singulisphaera sp. Ch08]|uniref:VWA domain-containing protein n=1 Tax=Singulisphaera sp. Ch08 TaxID=3120278 RepID=A0AAU7CPM0_9BACT